MKKTIAVFLTTVLLLFAFAVPVSAEEKKTCSFEKLIKYAETVEPLSDTPVSVLNKSVKIQNTLVMKTGDYLVIPRGKTLWLKNGAELDGNIYISRTAESLSLRKVGSLCEGQSSQTEQLSFIPAARMRI